MNVVPLLLLSMLLALSTAHHCNEFNINIISHSRRNWFGHRLDTSDVARTVVTDASDRESESSDIFTSQSFSKKVRETSSVHPHHHSFLDQDHDGSNPSAIKFSRRRYDHFKSSHKFVNQAKNTKFKSKKDVKEAPHPLYDLDYCPLCPYLP